MMLLLNFRGGCGKMHLIRETKKISVRVCEAEGPLQLVVDSYESYK